MSQDASDEQARIYEERAVEYDALVSAEDADGALERELLTRIPRGARLADVGAGTGRISRLLRGHVGHALLLERAGPMLEVARRRDLPPCSLLRADARALPLAAGTVDAAVAGWVFGHFRHWMPAGWRDEVGRAVEQMRRIVRPGGPILVIETLGTGHETPRHHPALEEYFAVLEAGGFTRRVLRTDYQFADVATAAAICASFFGPDLAARITTQGWARVPECTAVFCLES